MFTEEDIKEIVSLQDWTENSCKIKININMKEILKLFHGLNSQIYQMSR